MSVTYLSTPIVEVRIDPPPRGSGMTRDGYTKRSGAPTERMIRLQGEKRWRRLMIWQFSNMGTLFVNIDGKPHVVRQEDIPAEGSVASGGARTAHATRKSPTQLDREIAQTVGKRIDRKKLGEMMHPWSSLGYGPAGTAIYAVASHYDGGTKYPDRTVVERAIKAIEADIPKAEHGTHGWTKSDANDLRKIAAGLRYFIVHDYKNGGTAHSTIKTDEQWEAQVTERRKRDPGAWSSRVKLVSIARAAANNVFSARKVMTPALIKQAKEAAFKAIQRYDPLAGTSDHPAAAYSHGVSELAAEGTAQAERAWVPAKQLRVAWAKAGKKLVSRDKRFAIVKDNGGYNLIDLDTYNEYPASSLEAAKSKAAQLR